MVSPTILFSSLDNDMSIHHQTSLSTKQLLTAFLQLEILHLSIKKRLCFLSTFSVLKEHFTAQQHEFFQRYSSHGQNIKATQSFPIPPVLHHICKRVIREQFHTGKVESSLSLCNAVEWFGFFHPVELMKKQLKVECLLNERTVPCI